MPDLNQHDITARMAVNEPLSAIDTTALREAAQQGKDIRQIALTARCECGERHPAQCPGAWEPGCDLGNNEKHVRAATEPDLGALRAATAPTVEPEEGAPGEAGLRWAIGHALSEALGNQGDDGAISIDPFDSDNIDPMVDAVIGVLRERGISVEQAEPLTDEQVRRGWSAISLHPHVDQRFVEGVRFAEHALGITADGGARVVAPPAPAAAPAGEPAACISRTQGRIYAQLLPAGRSLPLGTSLYPQQSAAMFPPAPAAAEQASTLTDERIVACVKSIPLPRPMGLVRDVGPYEVTEPTQYLRLLVRSIEQAIGSQPAPARQEPLTDEQIDTTAAEWESSRHSFAHGDGTADVKVEFTARRLRHFARAVRSLPAAPITAAPAEGEKR